MIEEKYIEKIEKLNKEFIIPETEDNYEKCKDEEIYHVAFDGILEELLEELGYKEIVDKYKKAQEHFWYS